jgi:hypothetical protein
MVAKYVNNQDGGTRNSRIPVGEARRFEGIVQESPWQRCPGTHDPTHPPLSTSPGSPLVRRRASCADSRDTDGRGWRTDNAQVSPIGIRQGPEGPTNEPPTSWFLVGKRPRVERNDRVPTAMDSMSSKFNEGSSTASRINLVCDTHE